MKTKISIKHVCSLFLIIALIFTTIPLAAVAQGVDTERPVDLTTTEAHESIPATGSEIETEEKSDTLAEQLSSINEQLAKKQMRKNGMESDCFHCGRYCCCLHFAHYFCEDFCFFTEATEFKRRNASHCGSRWDRISN